MECFNMADVIANVADGIATGSMYLVVFYFNLSSMMLNRTCYSTCHIGNNICHIKTFHPLWLFHLPQLAINICHPSKWLSTCHIGKNICQPSVKGLTPSSGFSISHIWTQISGITSVTTNGQNICPTAMAITSAIIKIKLKLIIK